MQVSYHSQSDMGIGLSLVPPLQFGIRKGGPDRAGYGSCRLGCDILPILPLRDGDRSCWEKAARPLSQADPCGLRDAEGMESGGKEWVYGPQTIREIHR